MPRAIPDDTRYPTAGGIILAVLANFVFKDPEKEISAIRSEYWAAFSIWIGFLVTLVPAMFLSGLYYEMGRQLIPLACITTFFVAKGVEYALAKRQQAVEPSN
jgi:nucleoside recognition membrane protein YjiH